MHVTHLHEGAKADMLQARRLSSSDTTFVFDDYASVHAAAEELADAFEVTHVPACPWNNCIARRRD